MDDATLTGMKKWFTDYARSFAPANPSEREGINLKVEHTWNVCAAIRDIGASIELTEGDLRLAEAIALFHDVGRFEQYARYKSFVDRDSVNHAQLAVVTLRDRGVCGGLDEAEAGILLTSVLFHNRATLPADGSERALRFCRLVRDADKVDIWNVLITHYEAPHQHRTLAVQGPLTDRQGVSADLAADLLAGRIARVETVRSVNDFKLLTMGWVYDLNFPRTFAIVRQREFIDRIYRLVPHDEQVDRIYGAVRETLSKG